MTARPGIYQSSFNAAEIDPAAHGSTQLKTYYAGAAKFFRARPIPQGGFTLLPGSVRRGRVPLSANYKTIPFSGGAGRNYTIVLTPGRADIFRARSQGGNLATTIVLPYTAAQIPDVTFVHRESTLLLFHPDVPPQRIVRSADTVWAVDAAPWKDVPLVDYGSVYGNKTAEKWNLYITVPTGYANLGTVYVELTVSGENTGPIAFVPGNWTTTFAPSVKAALEALPSVEPGVTVTNLTTGGIGVTIEFTGAINIGNTYEITARIVDHVQFAANCSRVVKGDAGGEALMSAERGWPSCGIYFNDRLILGGFKAKPNAVLASRSGEYFDLNVKAEAASGAMLLALDLEAGERITHLGRGRHLIIFTTGSEWYLADRALARTQVPNFVRCSGIGTVSRLPVTEQEGAMLFANGEGTIIYAAAYTEMAQGYEPKPVSLLSSHLIEDIVDSALQQADLASDGDIYWTVRADGTMAAGQLLRDQDVVGFSPWATQGDVQAVAVDGENVPWIVVERIIGGMAEAEIETLEADALFDGSITQTLAPASTTVSNLSSLEGASVWVKADGYILGPYTVSGGSITIDEPATVVTAGRWMAPDIITLPLVRDVGPRRVLERPARVHTVKVDLIDTGALAIGANNRSPREVALFRWGDPVDVAPPPYTGAAVVRALLGFSRTGQVRITQLRPGPLTVRNITMEARL